MRRILFVDDEPLVLESLRDALRSRRGEWAMTFASGGEEALAKLEQNDYDVVVSDLRMPGVDGAQLLAQVQRIQPATIRLILSGYADVDVVARAAGVAHRFLAKPCEVAELTRIIERSCAIRELGDHEAMRQCAARATQLPCVPEVYRRLSRVLADPDATVEQVAQLVAHDVAITARVLQLANSAFFGGSRPITQIKGAVVHLGISTLKALVLSAGAFAAFRPERGIAGFSVESVQRHGALVAAVAGAILPGDEDALTAGTVHDLGLLVLAAQEPDYLAAALETARTEGRRLADIEYDRRGISHAEVGAQLLSLWGVPQGVVDAVAYHHRPERGHGPTLDAVAAVHIADALVDEGEPTGERSGVDADYIELLGVADRLPEWRRIARAAAR